MIRIADRQPEVLRFDTIEKNLAAAMSLAVDCRKASVFANDEVRRSPN